MAGELAAGTEHLLAGRLLAAVAAFERAVAESPTHAAHHNLAVALRARGDVASALDHARTAAGLEPTCAPTLALVGSLLSLHGDHEAALATLRCARSVDPQHDVSRYYLGVALAVAGDRTGAIAELDAVTTSSRVPESVRERARVQASDLLVGSGPVASDACSVPIVSEVIGIAVRSAPARTPRTAEPERQPGRSIDLADARAIIERSARIVALTGAGISSASGLATRKELWRRFDRDDAVSIAQFRRDPMPLWTVIRDFLGERSLTPNAAHRALAALPRVQNIITQNVEGLHQAAGSASVIELHGTLLATRCDRCDAPGPSCAALLAGPLPPTCACGGSLRPDVVLFGEWVDRIRLERAAALCARCDLLLVIGTAADVAPAADLPLLAASRGAMVIEIKRTPSRLVRAGALHLAGVAEVLLPQLVGEP